MRTKHTEQTTCYATEPERMGLAHKISLAAMALASFLAVSSPPSLTAQEISIGEALDCPELEWTVHTNYSYVVQVITQTTNTVDGEDAVTFLMQTNYPDGWILDLVSTKVAAPGTLTFWYQTKTENQTGISYINYADAVRSDWTYDRLTWCFTGTWTMKEFRVEPNRWEVVHDLAWGIVLGTAGQNMYLDKVKYVMDPGPPVFLTEPQDQAATLGSTVTFRVSAASSPAPAYQWRKDGTALADDGRVTGATTKQLTVAGLRLSDLGKYSVVATNNLGSTNSVEAEVLLNPSITADDPGLGFQSSRFGFNVYGRSGVTAVVEGSANLKDWTPLATNTLGAAPLYFSDPASTESGYRWYRVR